MIQFKTAVNFCPKNQVYKKIDFWVFFWWIFELSMSKLYWSFSGLSEPNLLCISQKPHVKLNYLKSSTRGKKIVLFSIHSNKSSKKKKENNSIIITVYFCSNCENRASYSTILSSLPSISILEKTGFFQYQGWWANGCPLRQETRQSLSAFTFTDVRNTTCVKYIYI